MPSFNVKQRSTLAKSLLFFSGLSALIYQTIWIKQLTLVVGVDVYAVTTGVSGFFAGLALGAALFGRFADRSRSPIRLCAANTAGAGILTDLGSLFDASPCRRSQRGRCGDAEKARIEASHRRLVDFYDIVILSTVANREVWATEEMAARVQAFRQNTQPNRYYGWYFGR